MMAYGRYRGQRKLVRRSQGMYFEKKTHRISHSIPRNIRQIHFGIGRISACKHRTQVIFAKLNFTNDNKSTRQLALKFKNPWSGESLVRRLYFHIPLSTCPAMIKSSGLFGRQLKSVNHDIRRPFRSKTGTFLLTTFWTPLERFWNAFRTRTQYCISLQGILTRNYRIILDIHIIMWKWWTFWVFTDWIFFVVFTDWIFF